MNDDFMLRNEVKALHQKQQAIEESIGIIRQNAEQSLMATLSPLLSELDVLGRRMDALLGESRSWIVGRYDDSGLPIFDYEAPG